MHDKHSPTGSDRFGLRRAAAAMLARDPGLRSRFSYYYARLRAMPRQTRRKLGQSTAFGLAGLALLLALGRAPAAPAAPAASIVVVNGEVDVAANGKCSLLEAFANANKTTAGAAHADCVAGSPTGSDTIELPSNGLFSLSKVASTGYYGDSGLPRINTAIVVAGNGSTIERAAGSPEFRFFEVARRTGDLTIRNLTLRGGSSEIYYGGAIYARGNITIVASTLTGNSASSGGAVASYKANVTIESSTITDNSGDQTGGAINVFYGNLKVTNSTISDNDSAGGGGAIYTYSAPVTINGTSFSGNYADTGGAINLQNSDLSIIGGSLSGNEAYYAGAVYTNNYKRKNVTLRDVTISNNTASSVGAMSVKYATLTIDRTTISGNTADQQFAAVYLYDSKSTIVNSTVSNNKGVYSGGIQISYGEASLINVTVANNTAVEAGGGISMPYDGTLRLTRTLISGNTAPKAAQVYAPTGTVVVGNFNLFGASGQAGLEGFTPGPTDIVPTEALSAILLPLASNGGKTQTNALARTSPAIDAAPTAACSVAPVSGIDQREQPRGRDGDGETSANECDIGAFEAVFTPGPVEYNSFMPFVKR